MQKVKENARNKQHATDLVAGIDYLVKDNGGPDWVAFPDADRCRHLRHTWVLSRNKRPKAPTFLGSPVPRGRRGESERSARLVMSYFHPWTLRQSEADDHVVFAGALRGRERTWETALVSWLDGGVQTEEAV